MNELRFEQAGSPTYIWGVTDILISETLPVEIQLSLETPETGKWGNGFDGSVDDDGVVTAAFASTASTLYLTFDAYDVDYGDEIELFLNDQSLGFLDKGLNNGLSSYQFEITAAQQGTDGMNELRFEQAGSPTNIWGVTDILISESDFLFV
jgi:hypothetical protein